MISFLKNLKLNKLKAKSYKLNRGMTYVELIVVLSIFAIMTSTLLFNYGAFQANVDIKVLANDIALKIVEAQKAALFGELSVSSSIDWKPSYGVYFDLKTPTNFIYFTNLSISNNYYDVSNSVPNPFTITKNNKILGLEAIGCSPSSATNLSIVFRRPNSGATITTISNGVGEPLSCASSIQITISSPDDSVNAVIEVYPSGRIQINSNG